MQHRHYLSVVVPVFESGPLIHELVKRVIESLEKITKDFEIILVEDHSSDNSWEIICERSRQEHRVKGLKLSKNFGQHHAISAGLDIANGDWVIVMDCDLQDLPEEIEKLHTKAVEAECPIVLAERAYRLDSYFKRFISKGFYFILTLVTGVKYDSSVANFGIYHRKVIDAIRSMKESIRYFPTMVRWVGFKSTKIPVRHGKRTIGKSSYNLNRLLNLALDIILAYSDKPLRVTIKIGILISTTAFCFAITYMIRAFSGEIEVLGYSSIIISIWLLGGVVIIILGVIGLYVGKIFEGVKNRPNYIIETTTWEK